MKQYFASLLPLLAALLPARAQAPDAARQQLDQFFAPLDKGQVPSAYLQEYAAPLPPNGLYLLHIPEVGTGIERR